MTLYQFKDWMKMSGMMLCGIKEFSLLQNN